MDQRNQSDRDVDDDQMDDDAQLPTLSASDALKRLQEGTPLENVVVPRLTLRGVFEKPITIRRCRLPNFSIDHADFQAGVEITQCQLRRLRIANHARFRQTAAFKSCKISGLNMGMTHFEQALLFENCQFHGKSRINKVEVGRLRLWNSSFMEWVTLSNCCFKGDADMRSFHAHEGMEITHCVFEQKCLLRGASVEKKCDFSRSQFFGLIDLSKAKLHDFVYLEDIVIEPGTRFAFQNAVADRILIKPTQIEGRLEAEQEGRFSDAMHEYGLLKRIFANLHRYDEEDWAFYKFKVCQRKSVTRTWRRPWTVWRGALEKLFLDWGCGYGTNPWRAVRAAGLILVVFAVLYGVGITNFDLGSPPIRELGWDHWLNCLLFSVITSVSIFTSGFGGDQIDAAHGWVIIPILAEALLGTLLWGLFIVAFSRKVIR